MNREKERKKRNKKKNCSWYLLPSFFSDRDACSHVPRKYISKETRFVSRFEVWNFRLKKRITRGRIRFFFLFVRAENWREVFESTLKSRNRTAAKRSHEGHYAERKAKERGRISRARGKRIVVVVVS